MEPRVPIGAVDDPLEHEADAIAEQLPAMMEPAGPAAAGVTCQARAPLSAEAPSIVHDVLRSTGRPLLASMRVFFEPRPAQPRIARGHDEFGRPTLPAPVAVGSRER